MSFERRRRETNAVGTFICDLFGLVSSNGEIHRHGRGGAGQTSRDLMEGGWVSQEARKKIMTLYNSTWMKSRELPTNSRHNTVVLA